MMVREVMTNAARSIESSAVLADAAEMMRDTEVGFLPVFESGRLTGVVTDRDLVIRGLAEGKDPNFTTIREIMTPRTAFVFDDQDVTDAQQVMRENAVRRVAVLSRDERLVGVLSEADLSSGSSGGGDASQRDTELDLPRSLQAPSDS